MRLICWVSYGSSLPPRISIWRQKFGWLGSIFSVRRSTGVFAGTSKVITVSFLCCARLAFQYGCRVKDKIELHYLLNYLAGKMLALIERPNVQICGSHPWDTIIYRDCLRSGNSACRSVRRLLVC